MVTRSEVLRALPPVRSRRDVITDNQDTKDIIREVVEAHKFFAPDYDKIGGLFDVGTNDELYQDLFTFCKKNIRYVIERDSLQTTRSPAALVGMGYGDCKHYAGFIGGVLDALRRNGRPVSWVYRFASYEPGNPTPQHVFVVANERGREVWIDPVLSYLDKRTPVYFSKTDKKVQMLQRIYGTPAVVEKKAVGFFDMSTLAADMWKSWETGSYYMAQIYGNTKELHANPPVKFLVDGLPYKLPVPAEMLRNAYTALQQGKSTMFDDYIKQQSAAGRDWTKAVLPPQGIQVVYPTTWQGRAVRSDMLRPVVLQDRSGIEIFSGDGRRLFFTGMTPDQTNQALIANDNFLLKLLACAVGPLQMAFQPYPDAQNFQRFYGNLLYHREENFLYAHQVKTFAGKILAGVADAIQAIGKGFVKFIGIIPRQAFLLMCKLNVANVAKTLNGHIVAGRGNQIRAKWEGFGGDYSALVSQINIGKGKARIFGIEDNQVYHVEGVGEMTVAAAIASAAPVIALLANFLKAVGDDKVDAMVDNAVNGMNELLKAAGEDPIEVAQSIPGGKPVQYPQGNGTVTIPPFNGQKNGFITWIEDNPVLALAGAGAVAYAGYKMTKSKRA